MGDAWWAVRISGSNVKESSVVGNNGHWDHQSLSTVGVNKIVQKQKTEEEEKEEAMCQASGARDIQEGGVSTVRQRRRMC